MTEFPAHHKVDDIDQIDTDLSDKTPEYILAHRDEFINILEEANPEIMVDIADIRPELAGHHNNKVLLAEIDLPKSAKENMGSGAIRFFEIYFSEKPIIAVFKPGSGENQNRLSDFQLPRFYTRERAAYVIDYFMDLGLVPPVVLKDIDGESGSLQLYIPHANAKSPNVSPELRQKQDFSGKDGKKMAMLDRLISNCDRNSGNYLVCFADPSRFYAIDHGCSFCRPKPGDSNLAYNYYVKHPEQAELDDDLKTSLQKLISSETAITSALPADVSGYIEYQKSLNEATIFDIARKMLEENSIIVD